MPAGPDVTTTRPGRAGPVAVAQMRDPLPRGTALLRGLLGWVVLCGGLGVSIGVVEVLDQRLEMPAVAHFLAQAALMTLIVVPTILLLRTRGDRRSLAGLGWSRRIAAPLSLGLAVGLISGLLTWVPALWAGWIRIDAFDLATFAGFLALNGVVLLLYEALPEELALRGYMWTNLRDGWGLAVATCLTTLLFPLGGSISSAVAAGIAAVFGTSMSPSSALAADPVAYVVQMVLFGLALIAARRVPIEGALFVAVAFHWTQLTITRALVNSMGWVDSGWSTTFVQPDAIALVLVHIVLAGLLFITVRKLVERHQLSPRSIV